MNEHSELHLHIEELVLHGIPPHDRTAIADAVERQLTVLLERPDAMATCSQSRDVGVVDAGALTLAPGASPQSVGHEVGRAIHGGLQA